MQQDKSFILLRNQSVLQHSSQKEIRFKEKSKAIVDQVQKWIWQKSMKKWNDLERNQEYFITKIRQINGQFGEVIILEVQDLLQLFYNLE